QPRQRALREAGLPGRRPGLPRGAAALSRRPRHAPQPRAGAAGPEGAGGAAEESAAKPEEPEPGRSEEAEPAEQQRPAEVLIPAAAAGQTRAAADPRAARGAALPSGGRYAKGTRHAAPGRPAAEREGGAEEAAAREAGSEEGREGLVISRMCRAWARSAIVVAALAGFAGRAAADDVVRSEVDARKVGLHDQVQLTITVEGSHLPNQAPMPALTNLQVVGGPAVSTQMSFVNGHMSQSRSWTYALEPQAVGRAEV